MEGDYRLTDRILSLLRRYNHRRLRVLNVRLCNCLSPAALLALVERAGPPWPPGSEGGVSSDASSLLPVLDLEEMPGPPIRGSVAAATEGDEAQQVTSGSAAAASYVGYGFRGYADDDEEEEVGLSGNESQEREGGEGKSTLSQGPGGVREVLGVRRRSKERLLPPCSRLECIWVGGVMEEADMLRLARDVKALNPNVRMKW